MNAIVLVVAFAAAQVASTSVERVLHADPELAQLDQRYREYLADHESVRDAETAVNLLRRERGFREAVAPFEEWLLANAQARQQYVSYLDALNEDPELRRGVKALEDIEAEGVFAGPFESPVPFMRDDPQAALDFLRDPQNIARVPQPLLPYITKLRRDDALRERLDDALGLLVAPAETQRALRAWWSTASDGAGRPALAALEKHLRENPEREKAWRARESALSRDPNAYAWVTYWHARVRRHPQMASAYYKYSQERAPLDEYATREGASDWPPESAPPRLPDWNAGKSVPVLVPEPARPEVPLPAPPQIQAPRRPQAPTLPEMPRVPAPQPRTGRSGSP